MMRQPVGTSDGPDDIDERVDGALDQVRRLAPAFAATPVLFVLVAYLALPEAVRGGPFSDPDAQSWLLGVLLIAAVVGGYVALVALPKRCAPDRLTQAGVAAPADIVAKVLSNNLVRMAVIESVGLLGFVATLLSGSFAFVITMVALTLVMNGALWLRRTGEWEEVRAYLKRATRQ